MPNQPDAVRLLRTLRPDPPDTAFDPDTPAARAGLERILATPRLAPAPTGRNRRGRRLASVSVAAATFAIAAVALSPFLRRSPDVVARAAAALNQPGTILHLRAQIRDRDTPSELSLPAPDARVDHTMELWQTAGARQQRLIFDGTAEFVEDWGTRTSDTYNAQRDELVHHTDPAIFDPAQRAALGTDSPFAGGAHVTDDLARLLDRAKHGDDHVRLAAETTIRHIPVYELRITSTVPGIEDPRDPQSTTPMQLSHLVYVDRKHFLPVRIVELAPGGSTVNTITDYVEAQRLPRTPENDRLLHMSPHPGAKEIVEAHAG
jgi:hypothetical protein